MMGHLESVDPLTVYYRTSLVDSRTRTTFEFKIPPYLSTMKLINLVHADR
jgi:hypothetical protein